MDFITNLTRSICSDLKLVEQLFVIYTKSNIKTDFQPSFYRPHPGKVTLKLHFVDMLTQ